MTNYGIRHLYNDVITNSNKLVMALLATSFFDEEADALSIRTGYENVEADYEDTTDYSNSLNINDDLETSLPYSMGYESFDESFTAPLQPSPSKSVPSQVYSDEQTSDQKLDAEYVPIKTIPFKQLSWLRCCYHDRRMYYKNVYMLSIVFVLLIGAHHGLVGIQTVLNADHGLVTLAVENALFVCSVMIAPAIIWLLGIRNTMVAATVLQVGYVVSNAVLSYYTLIPGAIIGGFSLGVVWVTANLYLAITATNLSATINAKPTVVIGRFNGIFYMFVSFGLMIGNIISSIYLTADIETSCDFDDGLNYTVGNVSTYLVCTCHINSEISDTSRYILVSIYAAGNLMAIALLFITVGNLPRLVTDGDELRRRILRYLKYSLISIVRVHCNTKASLMVPVFMLEGLQAGYYLGTFTTDFIAQCIGVRYVGFAVAVWAFSSAISSFVAGRAVKYVKRFTLFFVALGLSLFLCLLLIFFKRVESFPLVFLVSFGFGLSDGILKTGTSCLVAGRFSRIRTTVYSALRLWIGVGLTIHFALSIFVQQEVLLWIIVGMVATGMPLYGLVDRSGRFLCF